jgi:hypothetical protein
MNTDPSTLPDIDLGPFYELSSILRKVPSLERFYLGRYNTRGQFVRSFGMHVLRSNVSKWSFAGIDTYVPSMCYDDLIYYCRCRSLTVDIESTRKIPQKLEALWQWLAVKSSVNRTLHVVTNDDRILKYTFNQEPNLDVEHNVDCHDIEQLIVHNGYDLVFDPTP